MRSKKLIIITFIIIAGLLRPVPSAAGEGDALDRLLLILEQKKLLTESELATIREGLDQEKQELLQRSRALDLRERELELREKRLLQKEAGAQVEAKPPTAAQAPESPSGQGPEEPGQDQAQATPPAKETPEVVMGWGNLSVRPWALIQTDYRHFSYEDDRAARNGFDIRRAQFALTGQAYERVGFGFKFELQGSNSRRLMDAYFDLQMLQPQLTLRVGQFKEPFGLEAAMPLGDLLFAGRSMGAALGPERDIGLALLGSVWAGRLTYGLGLFSGDGSDGATRGDEDNPEVAARLALQPFKGLSNLLRDIHLGGSVTYAPVDRNNVALEIDTAGLTPIFSVSASSKFKVIQDAGTRWRLGAEFGWAVGPLALVAEYSRLSISDVATSSDVFDLHLDSFYVSLLWSLIGDQPFFKNGLLIPPKVRKSVWQGGPGALVLAARYDYLKAHDVYGKLVNPGDSISRAQALSLACNWHMDDYTSLILDLTRTGFDQPLLIRVDPYTGESLYSDYEYVLSLRLQFKL